MAIARIGLTAPVEAENGSSVTVGKPSGVAAGDLLLAQVMHRRAGTTVTAHGVTAPAGWTLVQSSFTRSSTTTFLTVWQKTAGASEPSTYQWTFPESSSRYAAGAVAYRGAEVAGSSAAAENVASTDGNDAHPASAITFTGAPVSGGVVAQFATCVFAGTDTAQGWFGDTALWGGTRMHRVHAQEATGVSATSPHSVTAVTHAPTPLTTSDHAWVTVATLLRGVDGTTRSADLAGSGALSAVSVPVHVVAPQIVGTGSLSATSGVVGGVSVSATLAGSGVLSASLTVLPGSMPAVLAGSGVLSAAAEAVPSTDVTNRVGGRVRSGSAVAEWSPAVVATPAHLATGHAVVRAAAYGPVTMQGAQPTFTVSEASKPRDRQRIIIGGKDVTYFRDVATPEVPYQLADPLLWGPATVDLPQVAAAFEQPGTGALKWLKFGKQVVVQRVNAAGVVTSVDYRGIVVAFGASGSGITVECGGHAQGRAALREVPQPIFSSVRDVGMLAWRALGALGLELKPRTGPETGVEIGRVGGMSHLDYIRDLCVKAQTKSGKRWTIMPNDSGVYRMTEKDTTTVHATIFCDDARNVADLRRDLAEEPNRIFATGVSPEGKRIRFGVYPGLKHGEASAYPFADGRTFGAGTTNAETTTGDGILVLTTRLRHTGYLSTDDAPGGYDNDCTRAVKHLQRDADLADTGNVNPATWDALFDLNVTGYSLTYSQVMPAAQRSAVRPDQRSASGAVIGRNPNYDRNRLKVDRTIDVGTGFWRGQIREWAWNELADATTANWVGTITLNTGAVLAGLVAEGASVTDADVMDVRDLRPGMNVWLPQFDGGTLLHVSGIDVRAESVTLTVDSRARDALEVWEVITRNRETRNNPARAWRGPKSSTEDKDSLDVWDEVGGILYGDVDLVAGWNVVPIVAGQAGTVSQIRLELADEVEFACAVFGGKVAPKRLNHLIDEPLTKAGTEKWEKRAVRKVLDERGLLFAAGTKDEPCGYSPGRKVNDEGKRSDHPLRGVHKDDASFSYLCAPGRPVLYLAVWVPSETTLKRGRVMWNQLEGGV